MPDTEANGGSNDGSGTKETGPVRAIAVNDPGTIEVGKVLKEMFIRSRDPMAGRDLRLDTTGHDDGRQRE